ncbi:MAG TPA: TonB-dependent receptor [Rheinheimera sp.]|uniref:TonB-dependent receptor n=1 Tax=Rheinheimera sp. TaxID=1869214 RepID=UPI002B466284|nr:TonB-dependent receptor [Rheinheimera sp.]HJS16717.1 TonB-dependent receptor [Rheinheimera sp.]
MKLSRLAMALALPLPLLAAESTTEIETISVSATRSSYPVSTVPATITVIDQEELKSQLAVTQDLSQILGNLLPSFSPSRQKLTANGETLRGREPLYMIDGVPQSTPLRNGSRDGNTIDPSMIERIEIIRGANAIQGMGASGGIINIITKSPGEHKHQVSLSGSVPTAGGSDTQSYKASYLFSEQFDDVSLVTGAAFNKTGLYLDGNGNPIGVDTTQGDTMDSDTVDLFIKSKWQMTDVQSLQLMINHFDLKGNNNYVTVPGNAAQGIPTTSARGVTEGKPSQNKVTSASLDYQHQDIAGGQLNLQVFAQDFASMFGGSRAAVFQDPALGAAIFDQSQNISEKVGSRLTYFRADLADTGVDLSTGLDWLQDSTYQELVMTNRNWVPETEFTNYAPFVQLRYNQIKNWTFSAGARYEYGQLSVADFTTLASSNSSFVTGGEPSFNELLKNFGVVHQWSDSIRVYASYSEGFSMPDVGRVLRAINKPNQSVAQFLNLQPVISDNAEVGIELTEDKYRLQLSYFQSDSDLGSRLQADADGIYSVMREQTEISGFEAEGEYNLTDNSSLGFTYARTDGRYDSNNDGQVDKDLGGINIAPERLNLYWLQQWPMQLSSRVQLSQLFDVDYNDGSSFEGYHTLDLSGRYDTNNWGSWTLGLENALDKQYITYYSQTTPANSSYFAGLGRTLNLNWQMAF